MIGSGSVPAAAVTAGEPSVMADLSCLTPTYIPTFPVDPDSSWSALPYTGYNVSVDTTGRVMVCASKAKENAITGSVGICVTR